MGSRGHWEGSSSYIALSKRNGSGIMLLGVGGRLLYSRLKILIMSKICVISGIEWMKLFMNFMKNNCFIKE